MRISTALPIAGLVALTAFACRDSERIGGPWGPALRGGQATQQQPASTRSSAQPKPAPAGAELAHHPERAQTNEAGPGPQAGVQLAPERGRTPGKPTGMGGGPSVTGRAGGQFEPATSAPDNR